MTGRVRFTPFAAAGVFALCLARPSVAVDVPFVAQPPQGGTVTGFMAKGDIDGDGDVDAVKIESSNGIVIWYENLDAGVTWLRQTISTVLAFPRGVTVGDLDRDGDLDVVVTSINDDRLTWFENVAGDGSTWSLRPIALPDALSVAVGDMDRDGDLDVIYGTNVRVGWYENLGGAATWADHLIGTGSAAPTLAVGDLDGDADLDVVGGGRWYRNVAGNGTVWTMASLAVADFAVATFDLDRDGDQDVISSTPTSGPDIGPAWFENVVGDGSSWTLHTLGPTFTLPLFSVWPEDLDGDGDIDVAWAAPASNVIRWVENTGDSGATWISRNVATATNAGAVMLHDVDGDGDPDLMASGNDGGFRWYRNDTLHESACFVPQHLISTEASGAQALVPADVDGDGDLDAVSTAFLGDTVAWHENLAGTAASWAAHTISATFDQAARVAVGDVDRDGDVDVAAVQATFANGGLTWFDNTAGNGSAWTPHTVSTVFGRASHVELIDLSGDGDLDLLGAGYYTSPTRWFENAAGNGSAWTPGTLPTAIQTGVATGDIDGDGDPDVASTESFFGDGLSWTENAAGNGSAWAEHPITTMPGVTYAMSAADMDGDGDLDVLQPGVFPLLGVTAWYENVGGAGTAWTEHGIPGSDGSDIAAVRDLDRDGDPDVVQTGLNNGVRWFENTAGNGTAWSARTLSDAPGTPGGLSVADLDGDGDSDVLSATAITNTLAWHENQAGQGSIAVVSQAPATANNSEVVSMLRATVTHLGRPGDGPVELASLGLRFEESPGDPLTTAEANALVESLRVYRDANGNGVFDLASDVLVTSLATLALTNGVQVVSFADGDPNVQVVLGAPRDYFVVVELTANASGQVPNQLMVTLLQTGPSASVLEDRTYDIALRLACPADVSSAIKQAVPVELIGFSVE